MPSVRVFYLLALSATLVVVGVVRPSLARIALILDAAIVLALVVDYLRARRANLVAEREWPRLLVQGDNGSIEVVVDNPGQHDLLVRCRDALHPALASAPEHRQLDVPAGARVRWCYDIVPRRRGRCLAGPLVARVLGPWRLAWSQRQLIAAEERQVYPQIRWSGRVGHLLLLADRGALGQHPRALRGVGSEPYALREYLRGDPPNKIHWKASARHGRLVTREDTWERGARLIILLDCARAMAGLDGERSKLDHSLAAALALTRVAVARGDRVTLAAFSHRIERSVRIHGGQRSVQAAYSAFYDLGVRRAEPAFDIAAEAAIGFESRRSTVVIFTSVVDLAAAELLRQAMLRLERRHRPLLINLQDPELRQLSSAEPEHVEDAFAKVAALDILVANRALGARLRGAGVRVVNAPADRLAIEALEAYLQTLV